MPTYVYACDSCGVQFEKFQSFKEDPIQSCPQCNKESVRRVFQPVGIVFKGSGWYITDSRNSNNATLGNNNNNTKSKETESSNSTNSQESKGSDKGSESSNTASDSSKGSESKVSESKASSTSS